HGDVNGNRGSAGTRISSPEKRLSLFLAEEMIAELVLAFTLRRVPPRARPRSPGGDFFLLLPPSYPPWGAAARGSWLGCVMMHQAGALCQREHPLPSPHLGQPVLHQTIRSFGHDSTAHSHCDVSGNRRGLAAIAACRGTADID